MMNKIIKLDQHLTNMIAAGEVVERPSGIVKELVENSLDAQATKIEVSINSGGIEKIKVLDNGEGMSRTDALLAFKRHSTSKIKGVEDLWSIKSLGFRGEALPSIASVSKVELQTNNKEESSFLKIAYGDLVAQEVVASNPGTSIEISGLFYKTPARLKHLKAIPYESALVVSVMEKFAFAYPEVAFKVISNEKLVFETKGNGKLQEVVFDIYGFSIAESSLEVEFQDFDYRVSGIIVLPQYARSNKNYIHLFINQRMIRSYRLSNTVIEAYSAFLPSDRYPIVVLNIEMDSKLVDVNVHPSKWEIRLAKEKQLQLLIKNALQESLSKKMQAPLIKEVVPLVQPQSFDFTSSFKVEEATLNPLSSTFKKEEVSTFSKPQESYVNVFQELDVIGQLHGKYILAQGVQGLYIIDQHAAEERTNYEYYDRQLLLEKTHFTQLLIPFRYELSSFQTSLIQELQELFKSVNLEVEALNNSLIVRSIPSWMEKVDLEDFMTRMLGYYEAEKETDISKIQKKAVATMACHSSIRFNRYLNKEEMQQVIKNLSHCKQPYHCPHGRPTFILLSDKQLIKEFYR